MSSHLHRFTFCDYPYAYIVYSLQREDIIRLIKEICGKISFDSINIVVDLVSESKPLCHLIYKVLDLVPQTGTHQCDISAMISYVDVM